MSASLMTVFGLYISDHPLSAYQKQLAQIVSYFSGQLPEAQHEEKVRVAGLITSIRPYQTKAGKPMGFVTLEDIQGVIDLVLFPRTWKQYAEMLIVGQIIIVEGKVDATSSPPKILTDSLRTDFEIKVSVDTDDSDWDMPPLPLTDPEPVFPSARPVTPPPARTPGVASVMSSAPVKQAEAPDVRRDTIPPHAVLAEQTQTYVPEPDWDEDGPPPPDPFPPGWDDAWQPDFASAEIASRPEPRFKKNEPVSLSPEVIPCPRARSGYRGAASIRSEEERARSKSDHQHRGKAGHGGAGSGIPAPVGLALSLALRARRPDRRPRASPAADHHPTAPHRRPRAQQAPHQDPAQHAHLVQRARQVQFSYF
jgi:hypothetical protein